jgi:hypothetical protein
MHHRRVQSRKGLSDAFALHLGVYVSAGYIDKQMLEEPDLVADISNS